MFIIGGLVGGDVNLVIEKMAMTVEHGDVTYQN